MRHRRKTGVVGQAHAPDRDLELPRHTGEGAGDVRNDRAAEGAQGADGGTGFGEDFWEGQRPPHW
ncbi:hypothetical protein [Corynebacterium sp.]|jgi:hypothetical protein|uniref:hypothetical protein n=1 Tax=Corynebacterium sp. TaxID=1720 RepID=UPI0025B95883|nr:hypothetical protein [Corynebacterium sp.]